MKKSTKMAEKRKLTEDARLHKRRQTKRMKREAQEQAFLDSLHFASVAKNMILTYEFNARKENNTRIRQFKGVLRREMKIMFLKMILKNVPEEKRNRAEQEILSLLKKTEKIELAIWNNRKNEFPIDQALKMYRAAAAIEIMIYPTLPEGKRRLADKGRNDIGSEIEKLEKMRADTPNKKVKVESRLLSIATKAAATRIKLLRKETRDLTKRAFEKMDQTVTTALPLKKER